MDFEKSIIEEFVTEAKEHLETVEDNLMQLEGQADNPDQELVNNVFRAVHTVKGSAGFLGLATLAGLAHTTETLLSLIRSGERKPDSKSVDVLLQSVDSILAMLDDVENSNDRDVSELIGKLQGVIDLDISPEAHESLDKQVELEDTQGRPSGFEISDHEFNDLLNEHEFIYVIKLNLTELSEKYQKDPISAFNQLKNLGDVVEAKLDPRAHDLRQGLPEGPLINEVLFATKLSREALANFFGMPEEWIEQFKKIEPDQAGQPPDTTAKDMETAPKEVSEVETAPETKNLDEEQSKWDGKDRRSEDKRDKWGSSERRRETIRLKLGVLDELMRLAGELVLVRNQQMMSVDKSEPTARANAQRLDIVTTELQETIMATRMQPIGNLFNKFTRVVRDLGKKLNKNIEITIAGSEVELDNTILEALSDPLTHLVRNCCDHGVESPEQRIAAGKDPTGQVKLRAFHESGQINIEIEDDGKGIDLDVIRKKALEKGVKTESELASLSDKDVLLLILTPSFSTADKLSDVSGRGVGMDVVKTSIEELGGTLDISSSLGKGSKVSMRLPLTLAIIPCLFVMVDEHRYAIPQANLEELVCLYDEDIITKVECAGSREIYRLRDYLLPLVRLNEVLERPEPLSESVRSEITEKYRQKQLEMSQRSAGSDGDGNEAGTGSTQSLNIAVLKIGVNRFGLIVDRVLETEEIVVKPMHPSLKHLKCYAGATVMGDGRVALILDVQGLAQHAEVAFEVSKADTTDLELKAAAEHQSVLLFASGEKEQFAIPLPLIRRIETLSIDRLEKIGNKEYITIDGVSTRVLRLEEHLNVSPCIEHEKMYLILPKHCRNQFGILVSRLIDSYETTVDLNVETYMEEGLLGTTIVSGKMTLFVDMDTMIRKSEPSWFDNRGFNSKAANAGKRILLVEDTPFYQQLVKGFLKSEGYEVTTADNGQEGLDMIDGGEFDVIISDIEMPVMDGFEFMKNLRAGTNQNDLPTIALTALNSDEDRDKAREAGFDRYETKLDKEQLLNTISKVLDSIATAKT